MARAKKNVSRSSRTTSSRAKRSPANRKSSKALKSNNLFSPFRFIMVVVIVAVVAVLVAVRQNSDVSNAIAIGGSISSPGYVGSLTAKTLTTNLTATVSGSSITVTGSNIAPGDTITVGRSTAKASLISVNSDGTTTVAAPVNTGGCIVQKIPIFNNLCNNATSGQNKLTITSSSGGNKTTATIGLAKTLGAPQAATTALGSALAGQSKQTSCPSGAGPTATGGCAQCGPDNCAAGCSAGGYGMKFIKPTSSDVWNYGTPFAITWQNCTNGLINLAAQPGGSPSTGGNSVFLPPQFFISFNLFDTAGEDAGPGGAVPVPGGGYKAGTGGYNHLCGILSSDSKFSQGLGVFSIPGLNDPGKTNSLTLSKCKTDIGSHAASVQHIPTGHYKVSFAIDVVTGVKGCSPGYRCSGLPDRIGPPSGTQGTFKSDRFQLINQ